jgi:hypothetical protein
MQEDARDLDASHTSNCIAERREQSTAQDKQGGRVHGEEDLEDKSGNRESK